MTRTTRRCTIRDIRPLHYQRLHRLSHTGIEIDAYGEPALGEGRIASWDYDSMFAIGSREKERSGDGMCMAIEWETTRRGPIDERVTD